MLLSLRVALALALPLFPIVSATEQYPLEPTRSRDTDGFLSPTVSLDSGLIVGTRVSIPSAAAIVDQFLGVPFAQSPPERFSPPSKPQQWDGLLETKHVKSACIQQFAYPEENQKVNRKIFNDPAPKESEDCLYLNVYAPESTTPGKAVLFWLYAGGLQFGDASRPIYNGSYFAAFQDVIVVTPNYRMNVFGFSNSPELDLEDRNAGFLDQRLALDWVQRNIAAFGGDPKRVTIFGNSAGGTSVDRLITTSPINPPFHAAIIHSGQATFSPYEPADGLESWTQLVEYMGCKNTKSPLICMRDQPVDVIQEYINRQAILFTPVTDNITQLTTADARRARETQNIAAVPVLIGSNGQEGSAFWRQSPDDLDGFLNVFFAGDIPLQSKINASFPLDGPEGYATTYERIIAIFTHLVFTCPTSLFTKQSALAGFPTWRYYYNASFPELAPLPNLGAYHVGEVPLVFGTYPHEHVTPDAYALSNFLQSTWASFAKNPVHGPSWNKVGQFDERDLAYIDRSTSGVRMLDSSEEVDKKCHVFADVYKKNKDSAFLM